MKTNARSVVADFSDDQLEEALRDLIDPDITLISRAPGEYESTHPIEDVSVSTEDDLIELVCKYSPPSVDPVTGHSRGAAYEGEIYRRAFPDPDLSTPDCYGTFRLTESVDCIVLEHISGYRIHHSVYPRGLIDICVDLGGFHSGGVGSLPPVHNSFNLAYFSRLMSEMELLPGVSARLTGMSSTVVNSLSNATRSLIHGELYPQNVLINEDGPVVIDWESAGVGPGVLDLAVLTQGSWDPDLVDECEEVYWRARGDLDSVWARRHLAAARVMAAGQLLLHLRGEPTDGVQEEIAMETIATQASLLSA